MKLGALLLLAPVAALAQTVNLERRAAGAPAGIAVPGASVAGADEAAAIQGNPAAAGFAGGLTLQYFHEGHGDLGVDGDGFWLGSALGPLHSTFAMQWIRPGEGGGTHFRKTTFGLAIGGGQTFSLGLAGNWFASPDHDLDRLWTFDAGLTVRPWRHLSLGVTVLGLNGEVGGQRLPVDYDLGVATRLWRDRLTVSADLLSDDRAGDGLAVRAMAVGVGVEVVDGLLLQGQVQFPVRSGLSGAAASTYGQVALTVQGAHAGVTAGGGSGESPGSWLAGVRLSSERYRSLSVGTARAPRVDVSRALQRPASIFAAGDPDPFSTLLRRLEEARDDDAVPAVVLEIDDLPLGQGRIEELRGLVAEIDARKPVVAYLNGGAMKEYYLATAARAIVAPRAATLFPYGLSSSTLFLRDLLARLGVSFDVVSVGRYKNAPDPLVRQDMSEAQREVTAAVLDDVFARQVRSIALARGLTEARVRELVDTGIFSADEAVAAHLIDATAWPDELEAIASSRAGRPVRLAESWDDTRRRGAERWGPRRVVAVVRVDGVITSGRSRLDPLGGIAVAGADTVSRLLRRAADDPEVVAIVVRVDSPGGDVVASDLIWREIAQARRKGKPVVASLGDLAASGGYLVSVAAGDIVAEPSTLTGSIGVFALKPDLSSLLAKIGVAQVTMKRGEHADLHSLTRRWTDEERRLIDRQVRASYDLFLARVAEGRRLGRDEVERVAGGRVWTGAQAVERRLVDRLGSLDDAVALARERAGFKGDRDVEVRRLEPERSFVGRLLGSIPAAEPAPLAGALARLPEVGAAALLLELGTLVALPPEWILPVAAPAP